LTVAGVPLNVTVLVPWVAPKFAPCTVTVEPAKPEFGETPLTLGGGITVKLNPLLVWVADVTTTLPRPVGAPTGTVTEIDVALQLVIFGAFVPLNVTVPEAPKLVPLMMTGVFAGPELGDTPVMFGKIVKGEVLLSTPPTVTTTLTLPAVAKAGTVTPIEVSVHVLTVAV